MKAKTLGELAEYVSGRVVGDARQEIFSAATLEQAGAGDISFLSNAKYKKHLKATKASAVVVRVFMLWISRMAGLLPLMRLSYGSLMIVMMRI